MTSFPDTTIGPFEPPPVSFADGEDRTIEIRDASDDGTRLDALVEMYDDFDSADRAQGLPPVGEGAIREWLEGLLAGDDACNVVAVHGDRVVGHATLVPDRSGAHELAIFVHQAYQSAGIGTRLLYALLGHGAERGATTVWLTVERWNRPAVNLYEKVGFERQNVESFTLEMAARIEPP